MKLSEAMAEQWAAMVDDGSRNLSKQASGERVSFARRNRQSARLSVGEVNLRRQLRHSRHHRLGDGVLRALADARNRLRPPGAADDDLAAHFTSDNVEVSLDRITSVRFGDYMNSIPLPAVLACSRRRSGKTSVSHRRLQPDLFDDRRAARRRRGQTRCGSRVGPTPPSKQTWSKRLIEVVWPTPSSVQAAIAGDADDRPVETNRALPRSAVLPIAASWWRLRIDMEDRGGKRRGS